MSCYPILFLEREIKAIVLCGGLSTRMGSDKGLIKAYNDRTWAENQVQLCSEYGLDTYLSIHDKQQEEYTKYFDTTSLIVDIHKAIGPLGGLLSAHNKFPESDFLVLSCDMIDVDTELLFLLLSQYEQLAEFDAIVPYDAGFYQPFPGLYTAELLSKLNNLLLMNSLQSYSLQQVFASTYVRQLTLPNHHLQKLKSYNKREDIS